MPAVFSARDFRRLWWSQVVSQLGNHFTYVALAWFVLRATGSTLQTGGVFLCQVLPNALFGWVAGVAVDRLPRIGLMAACDWVRVALMAALPVAWAHGSLTMPLLYGAVFVSSSLNLLFFAAEKTVVPHLVQGELLTEANAWTDVTAQAAGLAGPVLAGLAVAALPSPMEALYIDAASFLVSALALWTIRVPRVAPEGQVDVLAEVREGLRFLWSDRFLVVLSLTAAAVNFLVEPFAVIFPVLSERVLGSGAAGFGWLMGGFGGGMLIGGLSTGWLSRRFTEAQLVYGGMTLNGLAFVALAWCPALWQATLMACAAGCGVSPGNAVVATLIQRRTPEPLQGRVFSTLFGVVGAVSPLGVLLASALLDHWSARLILTGVGILTVVAAALGRLALGASSPSPR